MARMTTTMDGAIVQLLGAFKSAPPSCSTNSAWVLNRLRWRVSERHSKLPQGADVKRMSVNVDLAQCTPLDREIDHSIDANQAVYDLRSLDLIDTDSLVLHYITTDQQPAPPSSSSWIRRIRVLFGTVPFIDLPSGWIHDVCGAFDPECATARLPTGMIHVPLHVLNEEGFRYLTTCAHTFQQRPRLEVTYDCPQTADCVCVYMRGTVLDMDQRNRCSLVQQPKLGYLVPRVMVDVVSVVPPQQRCKTAAAVNIVSHTLSSTWRTYNLRALFWTVRDIHTNTFVNALRHVKILFNDDIVRFDFDAEYYRALMPLYTHSRIAAADADLKGRYMAAFEPNPWSPSLSIHGSDTLNLERVDQIKMEFTLKDEAESSSLEICMYGWAIAPIACCEGCLRFMYECDSAMQL